LPRSSIIFSVLDVVHIDTLNIYKGAQWVLEYLTMCTIIFFSCAHTVHMCTYMRLIRLSILIFWILGIDLALCYWHSEYLALCLLTFWILGIVLNNILNTGIVLIDILNKCHCAYCYPKTWHGTNWHFVVSSNIKCSPYVLYCFYDLVLFRFKETKSED